MREETRQLQRFYGTMAAYLSLDSYGKKAVDSLIKSELQRCKEQRTGPEYSEREVTGMREKVVEEYLREQVRAAGGKAYKFVSPGNVGVPDRLVLLPGGRTYFVELKAPGKKPTALQQVQAAKLKGLGFEVLTLDSKAGVDEFIKGVVVK